MNGPDASVEPTGIEWRSLGYRGALGALGQADLAAKLDWIEQGPYSHHAVRRAERGAVAGALTGWTIADSRELGGIAVARATRAAGPSAHDWAKAQTDRGRGVWLRGDPFGAGPELYVYGTRYVDLALSGPQKPFALLPPPTGGWLVASVKQDPADPVPGVAAAEQPRRRLATLGLGAGVLLFAAVAWIMTR